MLIEGKGLLLLGCGKMGGAMLKGWLANGLSEKKVTVFDPRPASWLLGLQQYGLKLNTLPHDPPSVAVIATKPQIMSTAIPKLKEYGNGTTLFISIAAGTLISAFENQLGLNTPIVRAMPNTPASIGKGITGLIANEKVTPAQMKLADQMMRTVGKTVILDNEEQMHAVTALSGSGPAYVFAMTEALQKAGMKIGLSNDVSLKLAIEMVSGAGQLMSKSNEHPSELRKNVTSEKGTTHAGLSSLMKEGVGIFELIDKTVIAASERSRELSR